MVVFRQKLLRHPAWEQRYGRLPVWMRRCLAKLEDCAEVSMNHGRRRRRRGELTSEKRFPHPMCWHLCGFSPVWVRMCTVRALLWMKLLPHPGVVQA